MKCILRHLSHLSVIYSFEVTEIDAYNSMYERRDGHSNKHAIVLKLEVNNMSLKNNTCNT